MSEVTETLVQEKERLRESLAAAEVVSLNWIN